jgi:TetR/AcrR family transcriptional repressor of bet genes
LRKGEARKLALVEATRDALAQYGFEETTLSHIADIAGVSPSLIIVHFKGKNQLLLEALRQISTEHHAEVLRCLAKAGPSTVDRLWALVRSDFSEVSCTPRKMGAWRALWSGTRYRNAYFAESAEYDRMVRNTLLELCRQIIAEGKYRDRDAEVITLQIDALALGLWEDITSEVDPISVAKARELAGINLSFIFPAHFSAEGPIQSGR